MACKESAHRVDYLFRKEMVAESAGQDRKAAFLRIFEQYAPALERLAGAYAAAREDREDLVQEIAAALWRALPGYRAESSERTWLYRIAHNVAITAAVKQRKREKREVAPELPPDLPSAGASAEQDLLAEEKRRMLFAAIRDLAADGPANHGAAPGRLERRRNRGRDRHRGRRRGHAPDAHPGEIAPGHSGAGGGRWPIKTNSISFGAARPLVRPQKEKIC